MKQRKPGSGLRKLLMLLAMTSLTACVTEPSEVLVPVVVAPPLKTYSTEELSTLVEEVGMLPQNSIIMKMVVDYGNLRGQIRALRASGPQ